MTSNYGYKGALLHKGGNTFQKCINVEDKKKQEEEDARKKKEESENSQRRQTRQMRGRSMERVASNRTFALDYHGLYVL